VDLLIITIVLVALFFDYTNGFHDAANAIATSVSTRALTPRVALAMAAFFNFVGAFLGVAVASTVGKGIIDAPEGKSGLVLVLGALIGAIVWNLITWRLGLPSSSSHALIGGLIGAALSASATVQWQGVIDRVVIPMILAPTIGFIAAFILMKLIILAFRNRNPGKTTRGFRGAQTVSAAAMALGHGLQDAQKTMGVIVLALIVGGYQEDFYIPFWVKFSAAAAISLGTLSGGARIMRTLGRRIIHLDPARGFAAESVGASVLYATAFIWKAPISTTQTITGAVMGVGATRRLSAVRWGVGKSIAFAWILTLPMAALTAAICETILRQLLL
jgi:PiT family inorganic phosphate transporter